MDLYEKCWLQNPSDIVETLKVMLTGGGTHTSHVKTDLISILSKLNNTLTNVGKFVIRFVLPYAKNAVDSREVTKSICVKSVTKSKLAYWRLAELMANQGYLPDAELLFFFTHAEIEKHLKERSARLVRRALQRRNVYKKQKSMSFPRFTNGPPAEVVSTDVKSGIAFASGMPVSVGVVQGRARVITQLRDAHTIQEDDILIVPFTDVGWAPYFPLISGIVTEQGGLVSHGAVVAREYGLPCIASCYNATKLFTTGDLIKVDGHSGIISKLTEND